MRGDCGRCRLRGRASIEVRLEGALESHSDRFLIGTDVDNLSQYQGIIDFYREVLTQLSPDAAKRIAHGNAMRLFRLSQ